jgi:murein DD-endopeptidase MepM/ murein hydrolase activator NlpD
MSRPLVAILSGASLAWMACTDPALAASWRWPVRGPVVAAFRTGPDPFAAGQHRGIDIAAPIGAQVGSACSGRVTFAGFAATAGRTVSVACGPLTATYLHLGSIAVRRGERVTTGARLGAVGRSGRPRSAAAHLHLGARWTGRRFAYVDPLSLLAGDRPPPVSALPRPPRRVMPPGLPPLDPAPVPSPRPRPARRLYRPARLAPRRPAVPWPAWAGLGLVAAGLPTGVVRRRRRRRAAAAFPAPASSARLRARS